MSFRCECCVIFRRVCCGESVDSLQMRVIKGDQLQQ
jgi:hypothetical protein